MASARARVSAQVRESMLAALPPQDAVVAERARRHYDYFVRKAWPEVPRLSASPLIWAWHMSAIAEHLQAVAEGQIRYLLINIPPRHTKTELVGVFFLPWIWTRRPNYKVISSSLTANNAQETSVFCREVVEQTPWYGRLFIPPPDQPGHWALRDDKNRAGDFANTAGGSRLATSVGGTIISKGADLIIGDDMQDDQGVKSAAERAKTEDYWDATLSSRANDPATVSKIYVSQRLGKKDLSQHLKESGKYVCLNLPTEYNPRRSCITVVAGKEFWRDPRTKDGELMNPARFPQHVVDDAKLPGVGMGPAKFKAQHNQDPDDDEGGKYKRTYWRFYRHPDYKGTHRPQGCVTSEEFPAIEMPPMRKMQQLLSMDTAVKPKASADWTVISALGYLLARIFVLDVDRAKVDIIGMSKMLDTMIRKYPEARKRYIEDKAAGSPLIQLLETQVTGIIPVNPGSASKEERCEVWVLPRAEAGQIYLPEGAPWTDDLVGEFASFPGGSHDDIVDTISQGCGKIDMVSMSLERSRALATM